MNVKSVGTEMASPINSMQTAVIKIQSLVVEYPARGFGQNATVAVKNLDLEIHPGEIFGFLGPNGAGKTSTIQ
ncbi:MAG: ATP-binding cassette domain-containing protein, partial [Limisphaerales bacterium]